jgi:Ser/Thr protein kinase RdoA (MazF antagonist)
MEKRIRTLFNDQVFTNAASKYGVTLENISYVGGFQNYVFEYYKHGSPFILRIAHSSHRSVDLTKGEIDWLHYLYDNGVSVSKAIPSIRIWLKR